MSKSTILAFAMIGCVVAPSLAQEEPPTVRQLPTEMCRDYFFIPITLADKPGYAEDRTLWFLHDTGASTSYVDPDSIARVSGVQTEAGSRVNIKDATSGPITFNTLPTRVGELDHLSMALGREIDGILSFGSFRKFLTVLDYQKGEIRLKSGSLPRPDGKTVFSARGKDDRPWAKVRFESRNRTMLIDSGAARTGLVVRDLERYETLLEPSLVGLAIGLRDIEKRSAARAKYPVTIGSSQFTAPLLYSTMDTELIGGQIMRHFTWTFDQKNKRFQMVRNELQDPILFDSIESHGLALKPEVDGLKVIGVLPGAPAEALDIQKGDLITHMDGQRPDQRGCGSTEDATSVLFSVKRGERKFDVEVPLYTQVP